MTQGGTKIFVAQARVLGRPRRISLGVFPDKALSGGARNESKAVLVDMRQGLGPLLERDARAKAKSAGEGHRFGVRRSVTVRICENKAQAADRLRLRAAANPEDQTRVREAHRGASDQGRSAEIPR